MNRTPGRAGGRGPRNESKHLESFFLKTLKIVTYALTMILYFYFLV